MKLSTKCRYGTRAIMEIAKHYKKDPIKRKEIVKNQNISDSYLENILITLKNSGIIITIRGANGGYLLRRSPSEINLLEIVNALEGSLAPVECLDNAEVCEKTAGCATRVVWGKLRDAKEDVLRNCTVQDLISQEKDMNAPTYCI